MNLPTDDYWIEVRIMNSLTNRPEPYVYAKFESRVDDEGLIKDVFDEVTRKLDYQIK
tara:strand:+ start:313 stop:483 length:171 start_codon:yes stop_codon:yes gene_type:complete